MLHPCSWLLLFPILTSQVLCMPSSKTVHTHLPVKSYFAATSVNVGRRLEVHLFLISCRKSLLDSRAHLVDPAQAWRTHGLEFTSSEKMISVPFRLRKRQIIRSCLFCPWGTLANKEMREEETGNNERSKQICLLWTSEPFSWGNLLPSEYGQGKRNSLLC